nr:hypothetical protein [Abalone asfa-like virus]
MEPVPHYIDYVFKGMTRRFIKFSAPRELEYIHGMIYIYAPLFLLSCRFRLQAHVCRNKNDYYLIYDPPKFAHEIIVDVSDEIELDDDDPYNPEFVVFDTWREWFYSIFYIIVNLMFPRKKAPLGDLINKIPEDQLSNDLKYKFYCDYKKNKN